jgi:GT2 family glycosyltransferase
VPSNWIDRIVVAHCTGRTVVGGAILNGTPRSYVGTAEHLAEFSEFLPCQRSRDCRVIPTCNLSVRRDTFDAAGGFEPVSTTELFKAEDTLLCHRLRELGHTIWFDPQIQVYHHNRTILRHFLSNQMSLGFSSAIVRRLVNTTGSILLKSVFLQTIIPFIKIIILIQRSMCYGLVNLLQLLPYLPLIFLGSCYYSVGFSRGVKSPIGITKDLYSIR